MQGILGFPGQFGQYSYPSNSFLDPQLWNNSSASFNPFANPAAFSDGDPFGSAYPSLSDRVRPQQHSYRNPDSAMLWSRGVSSPCLRHDHHLIIRNSRPPFSAGNWEMDWRHMIEIQFDQFGVASHCRSTWGRMGPWRAERYKINMEQAYSKLETEITVLMSRLSMNPSDRWGNVRRPFDGMPSPWWNGNGSDNSMRNMR